MKPSTLDFSTLSDSKLSKKFFKNDSNLPISRLLASLITLACVIWLTICTVYPPLPDSAHPIFVYSNQLHLDLKLLVQHIFSRAQTSIYIQIYSLTDPEIKELLKQKSLQGVKITIFYDPNASGSLQKELAPYGIAAHPVQCSGLMHRKIFIIDNQQVYLSTANLTTPSLKMHDNVVLALYHPQLASICLNSIQSSYSFCIQNALGELFFLPDASEEALERLITVIDGATQEIQLALFTFTHSKMMEAIIRAKQRGAKVTVAIDYFSGRGASKNVKNILQNHSISTLESSGNGLLHHKWALIDHKTLILGSANWTEAAFCSNQDFVVIFTHLAPAQTQAFHRLWQAIHTESLDPT